MVGGWQKENLGSFMPSKFTWARLFRKSLEISIGLKIIARRLRYTTSVGITGGKSLQITKIDDLTNPNPLL